MPPMDDLGLTHYFVRVRRSEGIRDEQHRDDHLYF